MSHSFGGCKFKIKVLAGSVPGEEPPSWLRGGHALAVSASGAERGSSGLSFW